MSAEPWSGGTRDRGTWDSAPVGPRPPGPRPPVCTRNQPPEKTETRREKRLSHENPETVRGSGSSTPTHVKMEQTLHIQLSLPWADLAVSMATRSLCANGGPLRGCLPVCSARTPTRTPAPLPQAPTPGRAATWAQQHCSEQVSWLVNRVLLQGHLSARSLLGTEQCPWGPPGHGFVSLQGTGTGLPMESPGEFGLKQGGGPRRLVTTEPGMGAADPEPRGGRGPTSESCQGSFAAVAPKNGSWHPGGGGWGLGVVLSCL